MIMMMINDNDNDDGSGIPNDDAGPRTGDLYLLDTLRQHDHAFPGPGQSVPVCLQWHTPSGRARQRAAWTHVYGPDLSKCHHGYAREAILLRWVALERMASFAYV